LIIYLQHYYDCKRLSQTRLDENIIRLELKH